MDSSNMSSDSDSSSGSDDSFCEHGYPLHEESPTVDKLSDKAVVVLKEGDEEVFEHMFLVPFMRGESPLNEMIKQMLALDYYNSQRNGGEMSGNHDVWDSDASMSQNEVGQQHDMYSSLNKGSPALTTAKQDNFKDLNFESDTDFDHQINDYRKLLSELTSALDDSLPDSNVDYDVKGTSHKCSLCDWGFSTDADLTNHHRLHSGERPYQCEFCIGNFQDKTALLNHRRQHTGERPFKCDICEVSFSQKHSLVVHKNVHTGEKRYKCDLCDSCFVCRSNLNVHMRIHTGAKPYTCDYCGSSYAQKSQLTVHKRMHTGEKPYKCQLCPAAFAVRGHLIHHIRVHTGEKPFKCDECGSAFTKRCSLRVHMRAHTGEKPYHCQFCEQAFHLKNMLTKHLLNFHRIAKKMPTPPQREGVPPASTLQRVVSSLVQRGSDQPGTWAVIPEAKVKPLHSSNSGNDLQGTGIIGDAASIGGINGSNAARTSHNTSAESSGKSQSGGSKHQTSPSSSIPSKLHRSSENIKGEKTQIASQTKTRQPDALHQKENPESQNELAKPTSRNKKPRLKPNTTVKAGKNGHKDIDKSLKSETKVPHTQKEPVAGTRKSKRIHNLVKSETSFGHPIIDSKTQTKPSVRTKHNTSVSSNIEGEPVSNSSYSAVTVNEKTNDKITKGRIKPSNTKTHNSNPKLTDIKAHGLTNTTDINDHNTTGLSRETGLELTGLSLTRFGGHGSPNAWVSQGYQPSPVAQRMLDHFRHTGSSTPSTAMKSMIDTYSTGIPGGRKLSGMTEEYHQLYSGILGSTSTKGIVGQRLPGSSASLNPRFSGGRIS